MPGVTTLLSYVGCGVAWCEAVRRSLVAHRKGHSHQTWVIVGLACLGVTLVVRGCLFSSSTESLTVLTDVKASVAPTAQVLAVGCLAEFSVDRDVLSRRRVAVPHWCRTGFWLAAVIPLLLTFFSVSLNMERSEARLLCCGVVAGYAGCRWLTVALWLAGAVSHAAGSWRMGVATATIGAVGLSVSAAGQFGLIVEIGDESYVCAARSLITVVTVVGTTLITVGIGVAEWTEHWRSARRRWQIRWLWRTLLHRPRSRLAPRLFDLVIGISDARLLLPDAPTWVAVRSRQLCKVRGVPRRYWELVIEAAELAWALDARQAGLGCRKDTSPTAPSEIGRLDEHVDSEIAHLAALAHTMRRCTVVDAVRGSGGGATAGREVCPTTG